MPRLLTISSLVARGHVGNAATTFPLMRLGHDVIALPTVVLAHHPGHAPNPARADVPDILAMGRDILSSPAAYPVDGMLVGYVALGTQAAHIAGLIAQARALKPGMPVLLDPICGDAGALYVDELIVAELVNQLLPMADIATPNVTELAALAAPGRIADAEDWDVDGIVETARKLGPPVVVVTSAAGSRCDRVGNLLVTADHAWRIETPRVDVAVHGTGDLLAGLILSGLVSDDGLVEATAAAAAAVHDVLVVTAELGSDELALAAAQDKLSMPSAAATVSEL